ncbi:PepSY-associated TM helix domain-containing protein [Novosphingobium album (ex Liu et al. 2023)]|uniref:PepSY domain-containing protein n=1 Tax=Novosphingobium album (ex Liu et al. 2023) TaxID=3031130 RepID=A0ABT5WRH9_9SPHN|nr:PepSY domain-containing protein [Novosphingobium album (ex Liu et al. 2023)]MDE8652657.1 PepSY domain-containing protein [Novosphingobium album (ex Liu et al. 2023)]
MSGAASAVGPRRESWYRAVWRWHFYAGLVCVPFVLWLSVTGGLYLFKPQVESLLYAPYRGVAAPGTAMLPPETIAARAVAAVPGSVLHKYVLPEAPGDAVQVLVGKGAREVRVWIHPRTGAVLHQVPEEDRLMRVVFRLHGELLAGDKGSAVVEAAACWTIVMLLTGLFLWWPRQTGGRLGGVLWPRLTGGRRLFWRDLHAVTGLWVTLGALFLIASGLPWAKSWGDYLRHVRVVTGAVAGRQDWSAGSAADARERARADAGMRAMMADHAEHGGMAMAHERPAPAALDAVVSRATALRFAAPVEVSPPTGPGAPWQVRSQAENRPLRDSAEIAADGTLIGIERFGQRHWIDRAVGYGVAIHEGAWWGLANQLVNLAVLLGLVTLCVSSMVLWWRRRPQGMLGAPSALAPLRHSRALVGLVLLLALAMPLFGVTLAIAVLAEALGSRLAPPLARWMGWRPPRVSPLA